jgi:chromate reductase
MTDTIHVLGFAGSLRKASFNSGLLRVAQELHPDDMTVEIFDLGLIPLFNQDFESNPPEPVKAFKAKIAAADALLIATPEYNHSIPGVLKNAIDWASRPLKETPLNEKPVALMGAGGIAGTAYAQSHLREVAVFTNMHVLSRPVVHLQRSWEKFDPNGNLTDEAARQLVQQLLVALASWTRRLQIR